MPSWMSDEGLAAWAQAILSALAILASAYFAVKVSADDRTHQRKEAQRRAVRSGLYASANARSAWQSVEKYVVSQTWGHSQLPTLKANVAYGRKLLDKIEDDQLPDGGLVQVATLNYSLALLQDYVLAVDESFRRGGTPPPMNFQAQTEIVTAAGEELSRIAAEAGIPATIG